MPSSNMDLLDSRISEKRGASSSAFDAGGLLAKGLEAAGRKDYRDHSHVEPLRRLLKACESEARLNAFGRYALEFDTLRSLGNILQFDEIEERNPAVANRRIERPVFIMGMPRSGTTFLHELLAQDHENAVPRVWELMHPYPKRRSFFGGDFRKIEVGLQLALFKMISGKVGALHPLYADAPQECTDITAQVFQSLRFDAIYRIPSYQKWLLGHGHEEAFLFHRRFLRHLDAQTPGRRWVLKSPDNVMSIAAITRAYPDASIVFLHRDPVSVMSSVLKLTELLRRPFSNEIDLLKIGEEVSLYWVEGAYRMIDAARTNPSIVHLQYSELVSEPIKTARKLYEHLRIPMSDDAVRRMQVWLAGRPRQARGRVRYELQSFGLDAQTLRKRFATYMTAFSILPDHVRLSGWDTA